jgi:chromosome segregation ATPase
MSEQTENLVLELLKTLRNKLRTAKADIQADLRDIKARLASLEHHQAGHYLDVNRQSTRLDDLDRRVERIEQRLELRDE